jgi:hypothetical protein
MILPLQDATQFAYCASDSLPSASIRSIPKCVFMTGKFQSQKHIRRGDTVTILRSDAGMAGVTGNEAVVNSR